MREKIKILVITDLFFLLLLMTSGAFSGVLSTTIYILSFIIPFIIAVYASKISLKSRDCILPARNIDIAAAGAMPTVISVFAISSITSYIMAIFGRGQTVELGDSLALALVVHALIPAAFEEALFRYIPMRLLARDNSRVCILISALFFALSHHSLFSIPYAFVAGVAFMTLDIISGSVLPSLVIHLLNNAVSVILMFYGEGSLVASILPLAIATLSSISLIYLVIIRKRVAGIIPERFFSTEKFRFSYEILMLALPALLIALGEVII